MSGIADENRFSPITTDDHAGWLWIATLLCLVYSVIVVSVRAHLRHGIYGVDDLLILGSTLFHVGEVVAIIVGLKNGLGRALVLLNVGSAITASRSTFVSQILFILSICLSKCSTVWLIMRLFNLNGPKSQHTTRTKMQLWICVAMLAGVSIWGVGSAIGFSVNCSASQFLGTFSREQCPNLTLRWEIINALSIAIEALILLITAIIVAMLQLDAGLKLQVILAFSFRLPLIALAVLYIHYVKIFNHSSNEGLAIIPVLVVQQVFICWSIISATIPNLKAFVRSFGSGFGIGIDMETYASASGTRKTPKKGGYELSSMKSKKSRKDSDVNGSKPNKRQYSDLEADASIPRSRGHIAGARVPSADSIESEGSKRQIIRKEMQYDVRYENASLNGRSMYTA